MRDKIVQDPPVDTGQGTTCPECSGPLLSDEERGETACNECGLVVDEAQIDAGPESRAFDSQEREERRRVGATTDLEHDEGLTTDVSWRDEDGYGDSLSSKRREKVARLRTLNERFRIRDSGERDLERALGEIDRMGSALGLSKSVRETAAVVYRRAFAENLLPGRSIEGVASAAIYAAARRAGTPRSFDEVASVSRVGNREIERTYRYVARELDLKIEPADPVSYASRFASELGISNEAERRARELLDTAKDQCLHSGKNPVGLAAAAVYAAPLLCDEQISQREVSDVTDISIVTIRNRYQELLDADGVTATP